MDRNTMALLLFGAVVMGGTAVPLSAPDARAPNHSPTEGVIADGGGSPDSFGSPQTAAVDLIKRFFETNDPVPREKTVRRQYRVSALPPPNTGEASLGIELRTTQTSDAPVDSEQRLSELRALADGHQFDIDFLIACVPDPIDSHLGWQFDAQLDAIQRAFENGSAENGPFVLDRQYFPWRHYSTPKPIASTDPMLPVYSRVPGVMLFRSASPLTRPPNPKYRPRLWALLLVGETPTRGVHKVALAKALDLVATWARTARKTDYRREARNNLDVRILGPSFSGSSMSMRIGLCDWADAFSDHANPVKDVRVHVISGGAQDTRNKLVLQFATRRKAVQLRCDFHGTMVPTDALTRCVFNNFLEERNGVDREQVAFLTEGNTVFGEGATATIPDSFAYEPHGQGPILTLRYPMQIGRMRTAYQRARALLTENADSKDDPARRHLQLNLLESPTANDLPAVFSPLSASSMEAVMTDMLGSLARRGVRYVGILGTDPLDILFLAYLTHQACPDVQLFTTHNDLVYTHPDYARYTEGMLVFTPYPLFIKSQRWVSGTASKNAPRQFSDSWAQGVYNATLALISRDRRTFDGLDYSAPFTEGEPASTKPPVWCLVVSQGALWPVDCYAWKNGKPDKLTYNDSVRLLVRDQHKRDLASRHVRPLAVTEEAWDQRLERLARQRVRRDEHAYEFWSDKANGDEYVLPLKHKNTKKVPQGSYSRSWKPDTAHLSLGLDGFLGFLSFLLSLFVVLNGVQYFALRSASNCRGALARWALFYFDDLKSSQSWESAIAYRAVFFCTLLVAMVLMLSPIIVSVPHFGVPGSASWHWRQGAILLSGLAGLFFSIVVAVFAMCDVLGTVRWSTWQGRFEAMAKALLLAAIVFFVPLLRGRLDIAGWIAMALGGFLVFMGAVCGLVRKRLDVFVTSLFLLATAFLLVWLIDVALVLPLSQSRHSEVARISVATFAERAANLTSGVSPIVPSLCVLAATWFTTVCHLRRVRWLGDGSLLNLFPNQSSLELAALHRRCDELLNTLKAPSVWWWGWLTAALVASGLALTCFAWPRETYETTLFKWFARCGVLVVLLLLVSTLVQVVAVWQCLAKLLQRLAWHPMATAYTRLPGVIRRELRSQLFAKMPSATEPELVLQMWESLRRKSRRMLRRRELGELDARLLRRLAAAVRRSRDFRAETAFDEWLDGDSSYVEQGRREGGAVRRCSPHELMRTRQIRLLTESLAEWWKTRPERHTWPAGSDKPRGQKPGRPIKPLDEWCEKAEELVAVRVAMFLRSALAHLRNYLQCSVVLVLLLLAMLNSYPFQPHRLLLIFAWTFGLFVIGTAVYVFRSINRDEVISNLSGMQPNRVDWDRNFMFAMFTYGVLPLLVLLATQFPEIGQYVYFPLEMLSKVLK